jgi:hypothetical protein
MHNWIVKHGRGVALAAVLAASAGCQMYEPRGGPPLGWKEHRRTVWDRLNDPDERPPEWVNPNTSWRSPYGDMPCYSGPSRREMERSFRRAMR